MANRPDYYLNTLDLARITTLVSTTTSSITTDDAITDSNIYKLSLQKFKASTKVDPIPVTARPQSRPLKYTTRSRPNPSHFQPSQVDLLTTKQPLPAILANKRPMSLRKYKQSTLMPGKPRSTKKPLYYPQVVVMQQRGHIEEQGEPIQYEDLPSPTLAPNSSGIDTVEAKTDPISHYDDDYYYYHEERSAYKFNGPVHKEGSPVNRDDHKDHDYKGYAVGPAHYSNYAYQDYYYEGGDHHDDDFDYGHHLGYDSHGGSSNKNSYMDMGLGTVEVCPDLILALAAAFGAAAFLALFQTLTAAASRRRRKNGSLISITTSPLSSGSFLWDYLSTGRTLTNPSWL